MDFRCEDLAQYDLLLIPPSSPLFGQFVTDIQNSLDHPVVGSPPLLERFRDRINSEDHDTSAILVNRSDNPVFALTHKWSYEYTNGSSGTSTYSTGVGSFPSLLLPFGLSDAMRKLAGYWNVVLPGSKRYLSPQGKMIGDNSDVRPPAADEVWKGGIAGVGGGGNRNPRAEYHKVTLTLDGVFFTDGGFAGPNRGLLWEQIVTEAEATMEVAVMAQKGHFEGLGPAAILAKIEEVTGPALDPRMIHLPGSQGAAEDWKKLALARRASQIARMRQQSGDETTVFVLSDWAHTSLPNFRKL